MTAPYETLAATFHRRVTTCRAVQVTASTLKEVAAWCGGSTYTTSVLIRQTIIDELVGWSSANPGGWVIQIGPRYEALTDAEFQAEWVPAVGAEQETEQ